MSKALVHMYTAKLCDANQVLNVLDLIDRMGIMPIETSITFDIDWEDGNADVWISYSTDEMPNYFVWISPMCDE